ncbi:MAG TPA: BTAD domain-containing putative transcriptional regulator [Mycobacteriales bacterium]|nr:BTAD domain-containing putative transcriptional regulator [Mycobacteriales bacterium]
MRIDVLGPLRVSDDAHTIEISRPKERALLAALATEAGSVVSIDRLVTHLWGEEPPPAAIGSLHAYVSNLRRLLEPDRPPRAPSTLLVSRAPGYLLAVEPADIDAVRFERMTADAREMFAGGDAAAAAAMLDDALALWRGPAFADFPYDDFAQPAIRRLDELRAAATEDRADALLALRRHDEVIADCEAALAIDPLRERVWSQLVVALYRAGRQGDALTAYRRAKAALDEIGLEPGATLRRLEQAVLEQSAELDAPPSPSRPVALTSGPTTPTRPAIVGRADALAACHDVVADVALGAARVLVVSGEPGIGKTALADALLHQARDTGMRTAVARCPEGGGAPALWPWMQLLRQLDVDASDDRIAPLLTDADEPAVAGSRRLFAGVLDVVRSVTRFGPLALLVDDVQWADEVSQALLQLAVVDLVDAPVLLVVTLRDPSDERSRSFDDTRSALARASHARHIALGGLDVAELAELVDTLDVSADADAVRALHGRTAGNPFFATQLVGLLSATGPLDEQHVRAAALPTGVRDVVRRRLARFPDDANAVLAVAAVAGPEVSLGVLERVAGVSEEQLLQILDLLTAAGLLVESAELPGVYRFGHDLMRDAIADALPGIRRARLHHRIAEAIVDVHGEHDRRVAHELARHSVAAVAVGGASVAIRRLIWSSRIALIDLALELSERQLTTALTLLDEVTDPVERDALEVQAQSRLGQVLFHKPERRGEANVRNQQALRLCRPDDPEQLGGVLLGIGCYAPLAGEFAEALRAGRQLLDHALATGHEQLEAAAHYVLSMQLFTGDVPAARRHIDRALALCEDIGESQAPAMWVSIPVPTQLGVRSLVLALDDDADWVASAMSAVADARRRRNSWAMSWAAAFGALAAVTRHDVDTLPRILEVARESGAGVEHTDALLDACTAWHAVVSGATPLAAGLRIIDECVERLRASGDGMFQVPVAALAVELLANAGLHDVAEVRRGRVESDARALGHETWLGLLRRIEDQVTGAP